VYCSTTTGLINSVWVLEAGNITCLLSSGFISEKKDASFSVCEKNTDWAVDWQTEKLRFDSWQGLEISLHSVHTGSGVPSVFLWWSGWECIDLYFHLALTNEIL
jgi:hypothetical protein